MLKKIFLALTLPFLQTAFSMDLVPSSADDFDLVLLVGQSNMAGRGIPSEADRHPVPRVLVFDKQNQWVNQGEPIHFDKSVAGVGPGFTFGKLMAEKYPAKTIGLIPCAVGGTDIARWLPGADLFEAAVARARLAQKSGRLKAILWHQGEASSNEEEKARVYASQLSEVIKGFRQALDAPDVPVIVGELGRYLATRPGEKSKFYYIVNEQIHSIPAATSRVAVVSSEGLNAMADHLHIDADSQREFGRRYFEAWLKLTGSSQE